MGIPEAQLDTWAHQGSITQSAATYKTIKAVLESGSAPYAGRGYEVFLQGSYGNDTNIYAESDVDIVIRIDDVFHSDLTRLETDEAEAHKAAYSNAAYQWTDFKRDVLVVLSGQFGGDVQAGDKAITVAARGNRRKADVIVAAQFRRYWKFNGIYDEVFDEGICFFNAAGERIENYPKQHAANLTSKHQSANSWLKPMIRIIKNMRSKLVADGKITSKSAPSYYLEGLLYNVPSDKFDADYQTCFVNSFNWIQSEATKNDLVCANEQFYLLRNNEHTCWPVADGQAFIDAAVELWNDWE